MLELKKLKVILLKKDLERVNLYLCTIGVCQYIRVNLKEGKIYDLLLPYTIPNDETMKIINIKNQIEKDMEELGSSPEEEEYYVDIVHGVTTKHIIEEIENKLRVLEEKRDKIIKKYEIILEKIPLSLRSALGEEQDFENGEDENNFNHNEIITPQDIPEIEVINQELLELYRMIHHVNDILDAKNNMVGVESIVYFEVWVLAKSVSKITNKIEKETEGKVVMEVQEPSVEDNVPRVFNKPPTLLVPFWKIINSLGTPLKKEINPTILISFTCPFLFGFMFADIGQGFILLLVGIYYYFKKNRIDISKVGFLKRYIIKASGAMIPCGLSAMFFGYLFGEYFGPSGKFEPVLLAEIGPFKLGGYDPMHEPLTLIRLTILIGFLFIMGALIVSIINKCKQKEWAKVLATICWAWFLTGGFTMWVYWGGISQFTAWYAEGLTMLIFLIIIPIVIMSIIFVIKEGMIKGLANTIEIIIETLDHTLSFGRLAALLLTHSAISSMFLKLGGVEHGHFPLQSYPLIAIGAAFGLYIESVLIMVHVLRLHWVELLPKFYSGKGIAFEPLNFNLEKNNIKNREERI